MGLAINPHGTRVVQKLIEVLNGTVLIDKFIQIFEPCVLNLTRDVNGNHVVIKAIIDLKKNDFLFETFVKHHYEIAKDKFGCCVLQKSIEHGNPYYKSNLINIVVNDSALYICDQYANYVLQYIISLNNYNINKTITTLCIHNLPFLSKQKFASNVIEKIFENSDDSTKEMLVMKLADKDIIGNLIFDMYGNYVIQKALSISKEPYYLFFIQSIIPHFENLKFQPFGTRLCQRLVNSYPEFALILNQKSFNIPIPMGGNFHQGNFPSNGNFMVNYQSTRNNPNKEKR